MVPPLPWCQIVMKKDRQVNADLTVFSSAAFGRAEPRTLLVGLHAVSHGRMSSRPPTAPLHCRRTCRCGPPSNVNPFLFALCVPSRL